MSWRMLGSARSWALAGAVQPCLVPVGPVAGHRGAADSSGSLHRPDMVTFGT